MSHQVTYLLVGFEVGRDSSFQVFYRANVTSGLGVNERGQDRVLLGFHGVGGLGVLFYQDCYH